MYRPFALVGFGADELVDQPRGGFSISACSSNDFFADDDVDVACCDPSGTPTLPRPDVRDGRLAMSMVTVPVFGFGMSPRGPEDTTGLADHGHHVRRGHRRVEVDGALDDVHRRALAADHVGAGLGGLTRLVAHRRRRRRGRTGRCRWAAITVPRTIWSALRGSIPRLKRDLDRLVELRIGRAT